MCARWRRKTGDESLIYLCSFAAQAKNLFAAAHKFSPALLPFKGVLPIWRHHPFSRQRSQRYNTLDFASKIVCQKGYPSLDSPSFSAHPVYTHRITACDSRLPENAKSPGISSSQWMKYQGFLGCVDGNLSWSSGRTYTFSILYPTPMWVWMYWGESGSFSIFLRSVAMKTRRDATSFSHELPQISCVI